ncbi:MAG: LacI family DNA-binding transcriptional regulator [Dongiaceae bacterium]
MARKLKKKVRLVDIAREARVGSATVERVLNARGNVAPDTAERVIVAAKKLGYGRRLPELYRGTIRIEVMLVRPDTPFFVRLNHAFTRIAASLDSSILVHRTFVDELDPVSVARRIANPGFRRSGLIIVSPEHPAVAESLREASDAGVVVVQIVTKVAEGDDLPLVGIDNYAAGRTAGFYMANLLSVRSGSIVALCHSGAYVVHRERIGGFSDYLLEHPSAAHNFSLVMHGLDQERRSAELVEAAIERDSQIIGIYNAGGASGAVASVLKRKRLGGRVAWIGHELTDETRSYLKAGLMSIVLDQAPEVQARRALDTVLRKIGIIDVEIDAGPVRFFTITPENA